MAIKTDNCQSTSDLASHLGVAKSRITRIADMLVEKELVTRNQNAGDRRLCLLKLTPKGDRLANDLVESFMELHGEVIQALPTGSQSETLSTLAALSEAMNSIRMRLKQKSSESEEI
jgi:DNA-binding MarR family transcriptional regulator